MVPDVLASPVLIVVLPPVFREALFCPVTEAAFKSLSTTALLV